MLLFWFSLLFILLFYGIFSFFTLFMRDFCWFFGNLFRLKFFYLLHFLRTLPIWLINRLFRPFDIFINIRFRILIFSWVFDNFSFFCILFLFRLRKLWLLIVNHKLWLWDWLRLTEEILLLKVWIFLRLSEFFKTLTILIDKVVI